MRNISNYSAISIRVNGTCSISAWLGTSDSEECVNLGLRSSTEPDTWNQLIWDLTAADVNLSNVTGITFVMDDEIGATRTFFLDDIELTTMDIPWSGLLANFEDNYVNFYTDEEPRIISQKTSEISYSGPYSMNITYTKLPYEEGWQGFGFGLPSSLNLSNYSAISIRVNGSCSISALLYIPDQYVYLGLRSSTEPTTWNQLIWDLTATDVDLSNVTGITFVMDDEIGATRTFFLDDIELTKMKIPWSGLLANFENNYVNFYTDEEPKMISQKTSERYYSKPYSMKITYTKLPYEEGWQSFGFAFPSSLNLSNYSAISIRVNGSCSISALLYIPDQYVYLGLRSSTEPTTWNQLIWDLTATDVDLSNVTGITFVMDDEIGATRTFFLDDIELTKIKIPQTGLLANFEDKYVDFWAQEEPRMIAKKTSEISYSGLYSMNITYTKLPDEEGWQSFGFEFPSSLNLSNYSAISIRVNGSCSISALLYIPDQYVYVGLRSSTKSDTWNQLIWDLTATDVNLSNVTGITLVMDDEIGTTRTFFLDDIELTKMVIPQSGLLANFEDNCVYIWFCTENMTAEKTLERSYSKPYSKKITYTKFPPDEWQGFGFDFPSSLNLSNYSAISIHVYGLCNVSADLWTNRTPTGIGSRSSAEPDTWKQLIWDLTATDVDLLNITGITFVIEDETGVTRTFFLDDIELTTAAIYVPDDYPTIQDAVNAANDGDTIIVRDGTYTENVEVDKRLTIRSENGCDNCIVQAANSSDHVFEVHVNYVNIRGFTLERANGAVTSAGIYLGGVGHCNISNNKASNNHFGILLDESTNNSLTNNVAYNNDGLGICLFLSNKNTLTSNIAYNNLYGIHLDNSSSNMLINNTAYNNEDTGILLISSSNNTLTDNTMSGNDYNFVVLGWFFSHFIQNIDTNNKVNEKPIYYWVDKQNQQIPNDAGYVGIINSTNISVKDLTLTNNGQGVLVVYTSNSRIENVTASDNYYGIWLHDSSSNTLTNNTMSGNEYNFVILGWSFCDFIQNIDTSNKVNEKPIYYWVDKQNQQIPNNAGYVGIVNSTNISVKDLTLTNNGQGVLFAYTSNSRIENVTASNNYHGICLEDSSSNTLTNNSADNNEGFGILLHDSSDNTFTNNNVYNNLQRGIYLEDSSNNLIYHNSLIDNGNQAYDNTGTNLWNNSYPTGGNYWNDYTGSDAYSGPGQNVPGSDGIGDIAYRISGDAGAQDRYPFMNKYGWLTKPVFGVELSVNATALSTAPGESAIYLLTVSNTGTVADTYTLSVENPDNADVAALSTYYLTNLAAGANTTVLLTVTDARFGSYIVRVTATSEGDSTKSDTISTKTTVEDTTPPASIINLKNTTYTLTYINWTWNDPADADFSHVMVYLNGSFQVNVSKGTQFHTATELTPDTAYTIGTRTVDASGNINQTWVNHSARTALDIIPPVIIHTPIITAIECSPIPISAIVTDDTEVASATLFFKITGEETWTSTSMTSIGNNYSAVIPASNVTTAGIEYYIKAVDTALNTAYSPATAPTTPYSIMVIGRSIITISVTPTTINLPESVTISGNIIPAHSTIVTLTFTSPTGSVTEQSTTSPKSGTYHFVFPPNEVGIWLVNATWTGDSDTAGNTSETASFTVNESKIKVGYAVIITGREDDDRAQPYIDLTANEVYKILTEERGFTHESIFYLNPHMEQDANDDGVYDVDRISSLTNISYAINTWAQSNVNFDEPLLIYMVDHGGNDVFLVNGAKHTLTASDMNNYLDQLTDATGCHDITVVYDACSSGSFIDNLSCTGRIIVTSTGIDADALYDTKGVVFSKYFFNSISDGKTIKEAFEYASNSPEIKAFPEITPLLDDNGDKGGHAAPLPNAGDGVLADSIYIGTQGGALDFPPTITGAIQSQKVVVNTNITIWAVVVDDSSVEDVYANIIEPNCTLSPANDTLIEINLTTLYLEDPDGDGNYTESFTLSVLGNYTVILHATDEKGNRASPKQRIITVVSPQESVIFDTGSGTYPSIVGTHNGTIKPNQDILCINSTRIPAKGEVDIQNT